MKLPVVWWTFGMAGFIHGIIVMLLVCIAVMEHHPIARYHERGPMTGLAQLLATSSTASSLDWSWMLCNELGE
jgi:hypothetical protein